MKLNIGNKEYEIEFTFEAALYENCVQQTLSFFSGAFAFSDKNQIKGMLSGISGVPKMVVAFFYAGLMENHGIEGDGSVLDENAAKKLLKQHFKENPNAETASFYGMFSALSEQMASDDFFERIGLTELTKRFETAVGADLEGKTTKN